MPTGTASSTLQSLEACLTLRLCKKQGVLPCLHDLIPIQGELSRVLHSPDQIQCLKSFLNCDWGLHAVCGIRLARSDYPHYD